MRVSVSNSKFVTKVNFYKCIETKLQNSGIDVSRKIPSAEPFPCLTSCPSLRARRGEPTGAGWGTRAELVTKGSV